LGFAMEEGDHGAERKIENHHEKREVSEDRRRD
jgi:hypothetical protein